TAHPNRPMTRKSRKPTKNLASVVTAVFVATATRFSGARFVQRLTPLLHQEVDECQCCERVSPPPAKEPIEQEPGQERQRPAGAGDTARSIGSERGAANAFGDTELALPQEGHDDGSGD